MDVWFDGLLVAFVVILCVASLVWHSRRSRILLERWAERNGYRILRADYRNFFRGPFFWTSSRVQTIYRVTVEGKGGVRSGWVRCGSCWLGLLSDQAEVRWDEARPVEVRGAQTTNPMHDQWIDG